MLELTHSLAVFISALKQQDMLIISYMWRGAQEQNDISSEVL